MGVIITILSNRQTYHVPKADAPAIKAATITVLMVVDDSMNWWIEMMKHNVRTMFGLAIASLCFLMVHR